MKKSIGFITVAVFMMSAFYTVIGAQGATRSVAQGVYTAEQAKRGEPLYKENCAACHGDDLNGSGPMPPLAGADFFKNWQDKTVGDLFEKTHSSMPANAPGTLSEQQTADILAYMLMVSKFPAGTTELEAKLEPLMQIKIEAAK